MIEVPPVLVLKPLTPYKISHSVALPFSVQEISAVVSVSLETTILLTAGQTVVKFSTKDQSLSNPVEQLALTYTS